MGRQRNRDIQTIPLPSENPPTLRKDALDAEELSPDMAAAPPGEDLAGLLRPFNGRARIVLVQLLRGHSLTMAATTAGVTATTVARWRKMDPAWNDAVETALSWGFARVYESELYDRALDRGDRASGRLLELVLKSRSPDYRDKSQMRHEVIHRAEQAHADIVAGWSGDNEPAS